MLAEHLTSSDFGVSTVLINQQYWEGSKRYLVNVERSNRADKLQLRSANANISLNNNSVVPIDVMVFIFYSDEFVIDVETE
jgi:hypothetical protein